MEVSYGKEPFDLRLTVLRLCRNLWKILAVTVVGTLLFGGGYYVKNVLLQPDPGYAASSTYKVEYKENPNAAGAYYINEATWNSLIHTGEFLDGVEKHLQEAAAQGDANASELLAMTREQWTCALSATLPSDFSIPVTKASTQKPETSIALAHAVEDTMCNEFAETIVEIDRIKVLDHGDTAEAVVPDVRPVRAVILAAVLSLFFAVVIFLLWEISQDSIWLPATLRRRYGLVNLGTVESAGFAENVKYVLEKACRRNGSSDAQRKVESNLDADKANTTIANIENTGNPEANTECAIRDKNTLRVAVCGALAEVDPQEVVEKLQELQKESLDSSHSGSDMNNGESAKTTEERKAANIESISYIAVPCPLLGPESAEVLRSADAVLLAVPAGAHVGRQLEAVLEYLVTQECSVDGALLWNADERLIRNYYFLPMIGSETAESDTRE